MSCCTFGKTQQHLARYIQKILPALRKWGFNSVTDLKKLHCKSLGVNFSSGLFFFHFKAPLSGVKVALHTYQHLLKEHLHMAFQYTSTTDGRHHVSRTAHPLLEGCFYLTVVIQAIPSPSAVLFVFIFFEGEERESRREVFSSHYQLLPELDFS